MTLLSFLKLSLTQSDIREGYSKMYIGMRFFIDAVLIYIHEVYTGSHVYMPI